MYWFEVYFGPNLDKVAQVYFGPIAAQARTKSDATEADTDDATEADKRTRCALASGPCYP